jgi:hypothetical protein
VDIKRHNNQLIAMFVFLYTVPFLTIGLIPFFKFDVDSGYTNGILTASSILFGIWGFILAALKPKKTLKPEHFNDSSDTFVSQKETEERDSWNYKNLTSTIFFSGFIALVINVIYLILVAFGVFSQGVALLYTGFAFFFNAFFLWLTLKYQVFEIH